MSSILGFLVSVVLSMFAMAGVVQWVKMGANNLTNTATAQQGVVFAKAVQDYVGDNGAAIASAASAGTPVTITQTMLTAGNYLPAGYSGTNPFRQTWQAQVLQPAAGRLETLVTSTGGNAISNPVQLRQIAAAMGAQGGYIPFANMLGDASMSPSTAVGAYGGWARPMGAFANPGAGHLALLLAFSGVQTNNGYLYRVAVPGQPHLNAMQTDLSMTDQGGTAHDINGIRTANAQAANVAGQVTAGTYSGAGGRFQVDAQGRIGAGGYAPGDLPPGWGGGVSAFDIYSHATVGAGSGGQVAASLNSSGAIRGANGDFQVNPAGVVSMTARGSSGAGCSITAGNSALTTDAAGVPLACVNGTWRPVGGKQQKVGFFSATDGTYIPAPDCPSTATPQIIVTMANVYIDPTASASYGASGGGPWTVYIRNGQNNPVPGGTAQVETFCAFS